MKRLLLGSTALILFAANIAAKAADLPARMPVKAPIAVVSPAYNWTGFYAGVIGGYGWRDPSINFTGNTAATATYLATGIIPQSVAVDPMGFLGGVEAGYNYQSGNAVFGFETDFSYADIHGSGTAGPGSPLSSIFFFGKGSTRSTSLLYDSSGQQKLDWFGTVRGRLGFTPSDRFLVFATGGLAYGRAELTASAQNVSGTQTTTPPGTTIALPPCTDICATGSTSAWRVGWTVGVGAEYVYSGPWSAKIEYLYYDLGHMSVSFADPRFTAYVFNASALYSGNIIRVGLNYKFN